MNIYQVGGFFPPMRESALFRFDLDFAIGRTSSRLQLTSRAPRPNCDKFWVVSRQSGALTKSSRFQNEFCGMDQGIDPDIVRRRLLVKSNPNASVAEMCELFDRHRVPLPHTWFGFGFTTWGETIKNLRYRARIKLLICRDVMSK
jgi:hypothetical protein